MCAAGVADQDRPALHSMAGPSIRSAPVDGVLVVEAAARRVKLNQLVAHDGCWWMWWLPEGAEEISHERGERSMRVEEGATGEDTGV